MIHAEEIMKAVAELIKQGTTVFTRKDVRDQLGLSQKEWLSGYVAIFQAMRIDHPGGAPPIGRKFRGVFRRIARGKYTLTPYGEKLLKEYDC